MEDLNKRADEGVGGASVLRLVLLKGILQFGGALFLANVILDAVFSRGRWLDDLITDAALCFAGGFLFGLCMWMLSLTKRRFRT